MPQIRVVKAFLHRGETIQPGTIMAVPDHALEVLGDFAEVVTVSPAELLMQQDATLADLQKIVGEALMDVDRAGRPWPARFLSSLPATDRDRLRQLEGDIDAAVINGDGAALPTLLNEWRSLLLSRLN